MKCMHCDGVMERNSAPFHIDNKGYHLVFDEIPAWICSQCGGTYFEEIDAEAVQIIIQNIEKEIGKITMAV